MPLCGKALAVVAGLVSLMTLSCGRGLLRLGASGTVSLNLGNDQTLYSGFLLGTVLTDEVVTEVRLRFDGGEWRSAIGTVRWKIQVPTATEDAEWKINTTHSVQIRLVSHNSVFFDRSYTVKRGRNKDFNGDGYVDVVVGASGADLTGINLGVAYIYHGASAGAGVSPSTTLQYPAADNGASFGGAVAAAGDVNGDGYGDVVVGAWGSSIPGASRGVAYIYHGGSGGVGTTANAVLQYPGADDSAYFGRSVSWAGDVNGDGFDDVIVGANDSDLAGSDRGAAYVYHGGSAGVSTTPAATLSYPEGDDDASFGISVSFAGDVNGDGLGDVIVGAYNSDLAGTSRGAAYVYHGGSGGVSSTPSATLQYPGTDDTAYFGRGVSSAGDVNGDGFDDVIVGAFFSDLAGSNRGSAYIYHGGSGGVGTAANTTLSYPGTNDDAWFGFAVSSVGDVNADGYADVIVGAALGGSSGTAYVYHGGASGLETTANTTLQYPEGDAGARFGWSVSSAGDVNGDGYVDVIVGAKSSDLPGTGRGTAYIYLGESTGLSTTATTTLQYPGPDNNADFGYSVSQVDDEFLNWRSTKFLGNARASS